MNHRALGAWILFGSFFVVLAPQVEAATVVENFGIKLRGKDWCRSSSNPSQGQFDNFNFKEGKSYTITITRDPSANDDQTDITGKFNLIPGNTVSPELAEFTMNGLGFLANKSRNKAQFVLNGFHPTDNDVFITMIGQAFFDKHNALTKASGKFIYERKDDSNSTEHCFGDGTFVTGKKLP